MSYLDWIRKGEDDLRLAELALENDIPDYAAFHAQQAVEKFLKAFLLKNNKPLVRTHEIAYLIEKCKEIDPSFEELYNLGAHYLSDFAVEVRYPGYYPVPKELAEEAIKTAKQVLDFIIRRLGE
ncbi:MULTISPECIES: HEPN domain-containing protein [Thermococcus]|uniref:HEPN domain protein n=1 Tax=Thermococcus camini TaxID=2016373 RepID=A0A7G2D730_9EURY|nr:MULTISPECIES: HEPN domain-containing protein [Thermococcus]NJE09773.1 HEPN domain-containing protein [Thermococcus sp. MAR1]CAD5243724.1 HEPN domain protein [Thermococcus camini]